jgi:hypothetical protein
MSFTPEQIERAGKMMKIVRMARHEPGHDAVSLKLNCDLTYAEKQNAEAWAKAFEYAQREGTVWDVVFDFAKAV